MSCTVGVVLAGTRAPCRGLFTRHLQRGAPMREKMFVALLVAGIATALSLPRAGEAASVNSGRRNSVPPPILVPQTPPPPIFNPGVTPSAPGPSTITPNPRRPPGL